MTLDEQRIYNVIKETPGVKARQIAERLKMDKSSVNSLLYRNGDLKELVVQKEDYRWYLAEWKTPAPEPAMKKTASPAKPSAPPPKKRSVDGICPQCGKRLVEKLGRYGKFYSCSGFPLCRYTETIVEIVPGKCPRCGNSLIKRYTKAKLPYYFCDSGRECGFITWDEPLEEKCKKCGKTLFMEDGYKVCWNADCKDYVERKARPKGNIVTEKPKLPEKPTEKIVQKQVEKPVAKQAERPEEKPKEQYVSKPSPGKYYNNI